MRKNQKGFTLVELIIAVAILAVVTLAVCGFIVVGSRSYTSANTDIMLQQDAQLALNQMSDVIIDTTESISYSGLVGGSMQTVLKDSEFSGEPTDKCLAVVNKKPEADDLNQNPSYWFYYSKDDETIYFNEVDLYDGIADPVAGPTESEIKDKFDAASSDKAVLAEHVTEFSVDVSQFEQNRVVMLALTFENGNRMYTTSNNVTVRNRIAINDITVGPMKRADEFVINAPDSITLEPGESYTFTGLKVNGEAAAAGSIKWSLLGTEQNGSTISENGTVTVGIGETRKNFTVVATRAEFADSRSTKEVTVQVKRVTDVSLNCTSSTVKAGDTVTINAAVTGNYLGVTCDACHNSTDVDDDVTDWKVVSNNAAEGSRTERTFKITINPDLSEGDEVEIEASSQLSINKHYGPLNNPTVPPVKGRLVIKLAKGTKGDYPINPGFKFGTDNDEDVGMIYDYMYKGLSDYGRYAVAVRVREIGETDISKDQVIMYFSGQGKNLRFNPDMFGLELNREYEVYMQVILPVNTKQYQGIANKAANQFGEDSFTEIEKEYKGNLDPSTGEYIGTTYESSGVFYGRLTPPEITVDCDGVLYPNSTNTSLNYALIGGGSVVIDKLEFGPDNTVQNVKPATLVANGNNVVVSVYKGSISAENRVSGFNPGSDIETVTVIKEDGTKEKKPVCNPGYDSDHFGSGFNQGMFSMNNGNGQASKSPWYGTNYMKRDTNNSDTAAIGTYYVVPGYVYANQPNLGNYIFIFKDLTNPDYNFHYYPQENAAIPLVVELANFNLELTGNGVKGNMSFPLPTDGNFPFDLQKEGEQTWRYSEIQSFDIYSDSAQKITTLSLRPVCTWDKSTDTYTIRITDWVYWPQTGPDKYYGTYKCKYGESKWTCVEAGTATSW